MDFQDTVRYLGTIYVQVCYATFDHWWYIFCASSVNTSPPPPGLEDVSDFFFLIPKSPYWPRLAVV